MHPTITKLNPIKIFVEKNAKMCKKYLLAAMKLPGKGVQMASTRGGVNFGVNPGGSLLRSIADNFQVLKHIFGMKLRVTKKKRKKIGFPHLKVKRHTKFAPHNYKTESNQDFCGKKC